MIPLVDDGTTHRVRVVLGPAAVPEAEAVAPVQPAGRDTGAAPRSRDTGAAPLQPAPGHDPGAAPRKPAGT